MKEFKQLFLKKFREDYVLDVEHLESDLGKIKKNFLFSYQRESQEIRVLPKREVVPQQETQFQKQLQIIMAEFHSQLMNMKLEESGLLLRDFMVHNLKV